MNPEFAWIDLYEGIANGLRKYRKDRAVLVEGIYEIASRTEKFTPLRDQFKDGSEGRVVDIDPFTVMGTFNRGITYDKRAKIATEIADFLNVGINREQVGSIFQEIDGSAEGGVPILYPGNAWFYAYQKDRKPDDIDTLWNLFEQGIQLADAREASRSPFVKLFDGAMDQQFIAAPKLTMGLFWIRPKKYLALDSKNQKYLKDTLEIRSILKDKRCSGKDYLAFLSQIEAKFKEENFPIKSFPGLSRIAWQQTPPSTTRQNTRKIPLEESKKATKKTSEPDSYSIKNIIKDGCFVSETSLRSILKCLEDKKNLILQGPPGTGKTWLAKRLAYALMDQKKPVCRVQFHPNLSYEDFVRGYRPSINGDGRLELVDGSFLQMATKAKENSDDNHVVIIEEINRGNPAQIFGEMLTLLEADKRKSEEALELSYIHEEGEEFYLPENLYVIGTMNIADRSLALVDLALRRRFAFVNLKPEFGDSWLKWGEDMGRLDREFLEDIQKRIMDLNEKIKKDPSLGLHFQVGHSYFTPFENQQIEDPEGWFRQIVDTEIGPYLKECWFDAPDKAETAIHELLARF